MFYSELLLIECSEADPGEGAGTLLQRDEGIGGGPGRATPTSGPLANQSVEEGLQMLTLLFEDFCQYGEVRKKKIKRGKV